MKIQAFDFSVNLLQALLWQYNEAERLQLLIQQKQDWYTSSNQTFWQNWVNDVYYLRTANDFGLSVWAIILDMPLHVVAQDDPTAERVIWGFAVDDENFTHGNFMPNDRFPLNTEQVRLILRLRYFQLVTRGTVPEINEFFADLFSDYGSAYVNDGLNMTARYVFGFDLSTDLETIFQYFDILPRPAGVKVDYVVIPDAKGFGFGRYHLNFTNGNFYYG